MYLYVVIIGLYINKHYIITHVRILLTNFRATTWMPGTEKVNLVIVKIQVQVQVHLFSTYKNNQNIQNSVNTKQFIHKTFLVEGNSNRSLTFRGWTPGQIKCIIKFKII